FDKRENPFCRTFANSFYIAAFLKDFARHVKRQIRRIDDSPNEAQIVGQQLLGVVHDEDTLDVQLDAAAAFAVPQVERGTLGKIKQLRVFAAPLDPVMRPGQRVVEIVGNMLVELL